MSKTIQEKLQEMIDYPPSDNNAHYSDYASEVLELLRELKAAAIYAEYHSNKGMRLQAEFGVSDIVKKLEGLDL